MRIFSREVRNTSRNVARKRAQANCHTLIDKLSHMDGKTQATLALVIVGSTIECAMPLASRRHRVNELVLLCKEFDDFVNHQGLQVTTTLYGVHCYIRLTQFVRHFNRVGDQILQETNEDEKVATPTSSSMSAFSEITNASPEERARFLLRHLQTDDGDSDDEDNAKDENVDANSLEYIFESIFEEYFHEGD